jgi:hypothetical protein
LADVDDNPGEHGGQLKKTSRQDAGSNGVQRAHPLKYVEEKAIGELAKPVSAPGCIILFVAAC